MRYILFGLTAFLTAVLALPTELKEPGQLALVLGEDDFEDYIDSWFEREATLRTKSSTFQPRSGCSIRVNGDLGQPQPVFIRNNTYMQPNFSSGFITLNTGEQVVVACSGPGRTIRHPNITSTTIQVATATCQRDAYIAGAGWLNGYGAFRQLTCSSHPTHEAYYTNNRCWGLNFIVRVGYIVNGIFHPLYSSCFNPQRLEVLYVWYDQGPENAYYQTGVDRPNWEAGQFFPGVDVNSMYTQEQQKATVAQYVGQNLANAYITDTQFLSRGHLAARTDFVFASGQRASFYFINSAPQWQPFNAGNWNTLEQSLRIRIAAAGYKTVIYTGTWGVTQLRDQHNRLIDIFLNRNRNQIPVPLYMYKVVYYPDSQIGTAFVSINNPYYSHGEARDLTFCTDRCRNNISFNWLGWQPDRIDIGYSFCCTVDDFRRTVPHLPAFTTLGLLT